VGLARDSPKKLKILKDEKQFTQIILPDKKGSVVKKYKVFSAIKMKDIKYLKTRLAIPTTYLINMKGKIVWRYVGDRENRPPIDLIFEKIDELL
jgi:peroxiredoxin